MFGNLLDQRKLIHRLRVVRHRPVRVHGNGHRTHAQESKRHQPKSKYRRRDHQVPKPAQADEVADGHQSHHRQSQVIAREIASHEARQNSQRSATLARRGHHLAHMPRFGRGKDFHQLRDHSARQRAAGNDRSQPPPLRAVAAQARDDQAGDHVGHGDRNERSDPHQRSQRRLEIHLVHVAIARFGNGAVDEERGRASHQHGDAHHEDPDQQLHLHGRIFHAQQDKGDQRDARDAIRFEPIRARPHRIARIIARCSQQSRRDCARRLP